MNPPHRDLVILVHGLLRSPRSWFTLRRHLAREGFDCGVFGYPSLRGTFEQHGRRLAAEIAERERGTSDAGAPRIHLVGHSLGNLVIRAALLERPPERLGRVVMLVPPNRGSAVARRLAPALGSLFPILRQLSDAEESDACRLPEPRGIELGTVAARFDHVVAESSTRIAGEADHLLVGATHSLLMHRPEVHRAIVGFLREGRFPRHG